MRKIKFRAWNLNTLQWDDDFLIHPDGTVCDYDEIRFSGGWYDRPELVIMQYTGLKDKNGKEIYEGDILQVSNNNNYVMEFKLGEFRLYSINSRLNDGEEYSISAPAYCKESTVIGNIYENPIKKII